MLIISFSYFENFKISILSIFCFYATDLLEFMVHKLTFIEYFAFPEKCEYLIFFHLMVLGLKIFNVALFKIGDFSSTTIS